MGRKEPPKRGRNARLKALPNMFDNTIRCNDVMTIKILLVDNPNSLDLAYDEVADQISDLPYQSPGRLPNTEGSR